MRTRVTLVAVGTLLVSLLPNVSGAAQDLPAGLDDPPYLDAACAGQPPRRGPARVA